MSPTRDDPYRELLDAAPDLALAPSLLMRLAQQPGDRRQNAQATSRAVQVASRGKALKQITDDGDDDLFHRSLDFLRSHSMTAVEQGTFGKSSQQLKRERIARENRATALGMPVEDLDAYEKGQADFDKTGKLVRVPGAATSSLPPSLAINPARGVAALNAGLAEAQHQYRALRDIQQTHGTLAAILEGVAITGGAVGGGLLGGAPGAVLGGEAAGGVTQRALFSDSWERTQNADAYRDGNGNKVMFGNDVASGIFHLDRGSLPHSALSGVLNLVFDLSADPVGAAAGLAKGYNATERAAGGLLGRTRGDTVIRTVADFDQIVARRPQVTRVFEDIAKKQAAEIARDYPRFTPLAVDMGKARTADGVANVLRDAITLGELRGEALPVMVRRGGRVADEVLTGAATDDVIGRMARFNRRVRTKLPMRYDAEERQFSAVEIDPASNKATDITALRSALKMSNLSERVINGTINDYLYSVDIGERRLIARNVFSRGFLAQVMGHDPGNDVDVLNDLAQRVKTEITQQMGGVGGMEGAQYGYNVLGHDLSHVGGAAGPQTAAIYAGQRGPLKLPEYAAWLRTVREEAGGVKALYGRMDDFAFRHIIVPFKGLALVTGGFALRVGLMAEGVPAGFREGVTKLVRSGVTARNAKRAFRAADDILATEEGEIADTALALLHNGRHIVQDDKLAKHAVDLTIANDGHIVPPALRAGHFETDTKIPQVERDRINFYHITQDAPTGMRETERFTGYRAGDTEFPAMWGRALNEAQRDEGARLHAGVYERVLRGGGDVDAATTAAIRADEQWLRANPDVVSDMMRANVAPNGADPILEFARTRVEATKGLTHFLREGEPVANLDLLKQLASEDKFSYDRLAGIAPAERPLVVKGRVRVPDTKGNLVERVTNVGFRKMVDPLINSLGRNHQYLLEYARVRDALDPAVVEGLFSHEEAVQKAQEIAVHRIARFIHNPAERTQVSTMLRNYAPFYFAQEQSYRRLGRLLASDPQAFRRYQIANAAVTDFIHSQQDAEGRSHLVIPALGFLDETGINALHATGLPVAQAVPTAILGNVSSLDTVLPFNELSPEGARPSWSVFVTITARALAALMPERKRFLTEVVGEIPMAGAWWEQMIPNTALRNAAKTLGSESLDSATIATVQALAYRQNVAMTKWLAAGHDRTDPGAPRLVPPSNASPEEKKDFQERVRNQARITYMMKAIISEFSPLAPQVDIGDYKIKEGLDKSIKKYGIIEGTARYLEAHPDATPYTVFASEATTVPIQPYKLAQDFVDKHHALFRDYPNAAAYLIPQDESGEFDNAAYQEQLALGLRERKSFKKFVQDLYVSEGFAQYEQDNRVHEAALEDIGDDDELAKEENDNWKTYLHDTLAVNNPVWWNYFTSPERENRRNNELRQLRLVVADKRAPQTSLTKGIRGLLTDLDGHLATLEDGRIEGWSREEKDDEMENWSSYLNRVAEDNPQLSLVIGRLFKYFGTK